MTYIITGVLTTSKRFKITTTNKIYAFGINLWRGSVWCLVEGKRRLLKRVYN